MSMAPQTALAKADPDRAWRIVRPLAGFAVVGSLALLLAGAGIGAFALRVVLLIGLVVLAAALLQGKARKFFSGPAAYIATFSLFVLVVLAIFATELSPRKTPMTCASWTSWMADCRRDRPRLTGQ